MDEEAEIAPSIAIPELTRGPQANHPSSVPVNENTDTNTIISNPNAGTVVTRIEGILAQIINALAAGQELSIPFSARRSTRRAANVQPEQVHFPGRNQQEAVKFARILLILQLSHDALVSGTVLTKRHIFYQHQDLFEKQGQVDDLVDDIAFTLGISRGDLNIVAASKGVLAGPLIIRLHDGSMLNACSGDLGVAIPTIQSISSVDGQNVKWILVVEKDAVFRSLCSSQFWRTCIFGPGVLVTAKGYPDLTTRSFLNFVHTQYPQLPLLGLFDYDPDGVKILRCYRYGSERLSHEADLSIQALRWLGITSAHLSRGHAGTSLGNYGPRSQVSITSIQCRDPVTYLNGRERATAISILKKISQHSSNELEASELRRELQLMIMLGVKAEIEWLDESGNLCSWLDGEIGEALISERVWLA
ncbi:Spo11/DNA topoisomerase VI subunit A [Fusarium redolens]|uniref:DNA topoisomerase (ATP-hydrolyzing) n=1 Tax=Fusarium redolens TaxID=48865 RepID=A0A9P9H5G8_FUSRE|nr:Spo11/DNA topoisomerase VI subunit A [Fusarium redolens]KAH7250162.1 Spo11/DNA topoisomerase VI subunit A [Fusarium redolens]